MSHGGQGAHDRSATGLRWSVERRLEFVERRLIWEGRINRADLVERFGVSPNQATADLKRFESGRPGALAYDTRARTYRAGPGLRPADATDVGDLLREFRLIAEGVMPAPDGTLAATPPLAIAEAPLRRVEPATLAAVVTAIREGRELAAVYRSFTTPEPRRRRLEPHALVFDGFRWHARARDVGAGRYKDFVLGRLSEAEVGVPSTGDPADDVEWHQTVDLTIAPHPDLAPHQRAAVEADYGMVAGRRVLTCRRAVEYYVRRRLGLVSGHERLAPADQHIVLVSSV